MSSLKNDNLRTLLVVSLLFLLMVLSQKLSSRTVFQHSVKQARDVNELPVRSTHNPG
jgi:hypothetical protein